MSRVVTRVLAALALPAVLAAGLVFAYSPAMDGPFIFDDVDGIRDNPAVKVETLSIESLRAAARAAPYDRRPLANLSFAANHWAHGLDTWGYHSVNVAVHFLAALGLYAFLSRFLAGGPWRCERPREIAFAAALLWAFHPVQSESVAYLLQRMTSLAGLFYFWGLAAWLEARARKGPRAAWLYAAAAGAFVLALASKELAATFGLAIVLVEAARGEFCARRIAVLAGAAGIYLAAVLAVAWSNPGVRVPLELFLSSLRTGEHLPSRDFSATERLLTEGRVVTEYLSLVAFPHPERLNLDRDPSVSRGWTDPPATLASAAVLAALFAAALVLWRWTRLRLVGFAILWFLLHLVIESTVLPLELAYEHRLYIPSAGPILLVAIALIEVPRLRLGRARWIPVALAATTLVAATRTRAVVWSTAVSIYADCARKSPNKARTHNNLAVALAEAGRLAEAASSLERALEIDPGIEAHRENLGKIYLDLGRPADALATLGVLTTDSVTTTRLNLWAVALLELGRHAEAEAAFLQVVAADHAFTEAWDHLGHAVLAQGRIDEAILIFGQVLRQRPDCVETAFLIASLLHRRQRDWEALEILEPLARRAPGYPKVHLSLAWAYASLERLDEALASAERSLVLDDRNPETHYLVARILDAADFDPDRRRSHAARALDLAPDYPQRLELERMAHED